MTDASLVLSLVNVSGGSWLGFIHEANEAMCHLIRQLNEMKGQEMQSYALACFGGAEPQHVCAVARSLGMPEVFVHCFVASLVHMKWALLMLLKTSKNCFRVCDPRDWLLQRPVAVGQQ